MVKKLNMQRRDFLTLAAAGVTAASLGTNFIRQAMATDSYALQAGETAINLGENGSNPTNCWLYNGACPGPMLRRRRGDMLNVTVTNDLPVPTTVHWHGIRKRATEPAQPRRHVVLRHQRGAGAHKNRVAGPPERAGAAL